MTFLISQQEVRGRRRWATATKQVSLDRTDAIELARATFLPGTNVMAVPSAVGRPHVREHAAEGAVGIGVYTIADPRTELHRIGKDAGNRTL